ncbi:hypothetical protein JCM10450v2_007413 [Rhodotorula kratochvilovae]
MAISHAPPHTRARYHYARLLLTPLSPSNAPIDVPTLVGFFARTTGEWFGTMGGPVGLSEVDVVLVEPAQNPSGASGAEGASEVVIRFPAGATHDLLTALPLSSLPGYRLSVLKDAGDLARLAGAAGRGAAGYKGWVRGVKAQAVGAAGEVRGEGEGMQEG